MGTQLEELKGGEWGGGRSYREGIEGEPHSPARAAGPKGPGVLWMSPLAT